MKITVTHDDGTTVDVTEGVQVAYDIAYHSMDWGSGFLDTEEMDAVARLAEACRFPSFEDALAEVANQRDKEARAQEMADRQRQAQRDQEERMRAIEAQRETEQAARLRLIIQGWQLP